MTDRLRECAACKVSYPLELLSREICGICALDESNRIHGIKRRKFDGEIAEGMRQDAIKWRASRLQSRMEGRKG